MVSQNKQCPNTSSDYGNEKLLIFANFGILTL